MIILSLYKKEIILTILFAVLHSLIFHFPELWWVAFFSVVPLFFCIEHLKSYAEALWFGYLAGVLFFIFTLYWVAYVTILGLVVLGLYLGIYFALFNFLSYKALLILSKSGSKDFSYSWVKILTVASIWVLLEYVRSYIPVMGFPWALLGYSQWKNLVFIQSADIFGIYGTSFILIICNLCIYSFIRIALRFCAREISFKHTISQASIIVLILSVILVGNYFYGTRTLERMERMLLRGQKFKITVIQGNIPQSEKWDERIRGMIYRKYEGLSRQVLLEKPDLVIWPETSFPGYWELEPEMAAKFRTLVKSLGMRFLIGAPTLTQQGLVSKKQNSALYFDEKGYEVDRYSKLRLVPFGEYIPFLSIIGKFYPIANFAPGAGMVIFEQALRGAKEGKAFFSVLICFEDTFPDLSRKLVNLGANLLINMTNDAWFMNSSAPYQHAQASVFRAVENRVPLVRAANTGLSCFIDLRGKITNAVQDDGKNLFVTGFKTDDVRLQNIPTFYRKFGDFILFVCLGLLLATYPIYLKKTSKIN